MSDLDHQSPLVAAAGTVPPMSLGVAQAQGAEELGGALASDDVVASKMPVKEMVALFVAQKDTVTDCNALGVVRAGVRVRIGERHFGPSLSALF